MAKSGEEDDHQERELETEEVAQSGSCWARPNSPHGEVPKSPGAQHPALPEVCRGSWAWENLGHHQKLSGAQFL